MLKSSLQATLATAPRAVLRHKSSTHTVILQHVFVLKLPPYKCWAACLDLMNKSIPELPIGACKHPMVSESPSSDTQSPFSSNSASKSTKARSCAVASHPMGQRWQAVGLMSILSSQMRQRVSAANTKPTQAQSWFGWTADPQSQRFVESHHHHRSHREMQ